MGGSSGKLTDTNKQDVTLFVIGANKIFERQSLNPIPLNIKRQPKALGGCQIGTCLQFTM